MAGPWEKYQSAPQSDGPWAKYQTAPETGPEPYDPKSGSAVGSFVRGLVNEIEKSPVASAARNLASAATFNLANPAVAAANAVLPADAWASNAPTYSERYDQNRQFLSNRSRNDSERNPMSSFAGSVAGGFVNPAIRALAPIKSIGGALMQGGGIGAAYGAGSGVSEGKDIYGIGSDAVSGGVGGALTGGGLYGASRVIRGATQTDAARRLNREGVPTTIGQNLGGGFQRVEDGMTSAPVIGDGIIKRQTEGIEGLNRAAYNRMLASFDNIIPGLPKLRVPDGHPVGSDTISALNTFKGKMYDHAFQGAVIKPSQQQFTQDVKNAISEAAWTLGPDKGQQIFNNVERLIDRKMMGSGGLAGDDLIFAKNWFSGQSRVGPNASKEDQSVGEAYGKIYRAIKDAIADADPARGKLLNAADKANMMMVRIERAAGTNAASGRDGVFTGAGLGTAVRTSENSTNRRNFAEGKSPLQSLARDGQSTLAATVPDSGTGFRRFLTHTLPAIGAGIGVGAINLPAAVAGAGLLGAGRALYSKPGQKAANALLFGAPQARSKAAQASLLAAPGAFGLLGGQ